MKYIWEPEDVFPGRRVTSHNGAEEYIIGYDPSVRGESRLTLVSMIDGQEVMRGKTCHSMAAELNDLVPHSIIDSLGKGTFAYVPLTIESKRKIT